MMERHVLTPEEAQMVLSTDPPACPTPGCSGRLSEGERAFGRFSSVRVLKVERDPTKSELYCPVEHKSWDFPQPKEPEW